MESVRRTKCNRGMDSRTHPIRKQDSYPAQNSVPCSPDPTLGSMGGGAVQGNEGPALTALVLFHNTTSIFSGFSLNPHDPVGQTKAGISSPILQVREWGLQGCYMIGSQVF